MSPIPIRRIPIPFSIHPRTTSTFTKQIHTRHRASKLWAPTGGIDDSVESNDVAQSLLVKGGFLRQAHSGVFHLLPLGLRVQNRLETLIDKHMSSLDASKLSLSSLTTDHLWRKSGRLNKNGELFKVQDRRESGFLLSPTHEEEITALVSSIVQSYKHLPLRLYQISRKYRDEKRPRQGLLRAKEFLMKDLYTFDATEEQALSTYTDVVQAYKAFFQELKLPYLVANADSGDMGGNLSHEFHFVASNGEDEVFGCSSNHCDYVANKEVVKTRNDGILNMGHGNFLGKDDYVFWFGHNADYSQLVCFVYPKQTRVLPKSKDTIENNKLNLNLVKTLAPQITSSLHESGTRLSTIAENERLSNIKCFVDYRVTPADWQMHLQDVLKRHNLGLHMEAVEGTQHSLNLLTVEDGDSCPRCEEGILSKKRAIEVGHTFHLGTRYSEPLDATVMTASTEDSIPKQTPMHMGCHGIGVSRLMSAIAGLCNDKKGLKWPRSIAPYQAVIIYKAEFKEDAEALYDEMSKPEVDCTTLLDDREDDFSWRLKDADLIGYPTRIILGRSYVKSKLLEVYDRLTGESLEMSKKDLLTKYLPSLS